MRRSRSSCRSSCSQWQPPRGPSDPDVGDSATLPACHTPPSLSNTLPLSPSVWASLVTEDDRGLNAHRADGGNQTPSHRYGEQQGANTDINSWIRCADAKQETCHQLRKNKRARQPDPHSDRDDLHALPHNETDDVRGPPAECDANADVL